MKASNIYSYFWMITNIYSDSYAKSNAIDYIHCYKKIGIKLNIYNEIKSNKNSIFIVFFGIINYVAIDCLGSHL